MEETMNTELETKMEVIEQEETNQEIEENETSGPSKGFIALCAAGVASVIAIVMITHKKKKSKKSGDESNIDSEIVEEFHDVVFQDAENIDSEEKSSKK